MEDNMEGLLGAEYESCTNGTSFPFRLWTMVHKCAVKDVIRWNADGTRVVIDVKNFTSCVLASYPGLLKTSNLLSFKRQLNNHGFTVVPSIDIGERPAVGRPKGASKRKVNKTKPTITLEYAHPYFLRGRSDLLVHVVAQRQKKPSYTNKAAGDIDFKREGPTTSRRSLPARSKKVKYTEDHWEPSCYHCTEHETSESGSSSSDGDSDIDDGTSRQDQAHPPSHGQDQAIPPVHGKEGFNEAFNFPNFPAFPWPGPAERVVMLPFIVTSHGYVPMAPWRRFNQEPSSARRPMRPGHSEQKPKSPKPHMRTARHNRGGYAREEDVAVPSNSSFHDHAGRTAKISSRNVPRSSTKPRVRPPPTEELYDSIPAHSVSSEDSLADHSHILSNSVLLPQPLED